jgi:hypothetical protein
MGHEIELSYKEMLLLETIEELGECTVNDCIDHLWNQASHNTKIKYGWRFFVHINKLPAKLAKKNLIIDTGKKKQGEFTMEKVWKLI